MVNIAIKKKKALATVSHSVAFSLRVFTIAILYVVLINARYCVTA